MKEGRWMVIRRTSGSVVELSTVFVSANTRPRRNRRRGATTAQKQDQNERDCIKRLARAINCNFGQGDLHLVLHYSDEGLDQLARCAKTGIQAGETAEDALIEAAEHQCTLWLRRLKRALPGVTVRSISSTSDLSSKTGDLVRPHHHVILPRECAQAAIKAWALGSVSYNELDGREDHTELANYICRQVRRRSNKQKYHCSRNLKQPIVNERWAKPGEVLCPDPKGRLTGRGAWDGFGPQYIRFVKGKVLPAGRGARKHREETEALMAQIMTERAKVWEGPEDVEV